MLNRSQISWKLDFFFNHNEHHEQTNQQTNKPGWSQYLAEVKTQHFHKLKYSPWHWYPCGETTPLQNKHSQSHTKTTMLAAKSLHWCKWCCIMWLYNLTVSCNKEVKAQIYAYYIKQTSYLYLKFLHVGTINHYDMGFTYLKLNIRIVFEITVMWYFKTAPIHRGSWFLWLFWDFLLSIDQITLTAFTVTKIGTKEYLVHKYFHTFGK